MQISYAIVMVVQTHLLDDILVDGLRHVNDFESSLLHALHEGRIGHSLFALACRQVGEEERGLEERGRR